MSRANSGRRRQRGRARSRGPDHAALGARRAWRHAIPCCAAPSGIMTRYSGGRSCAFLPARKTFPMSHRTPRCPTRSHPERSPLSSSEPSQEGSFEGRFGCDECPAPIYRATPAPRFSIGTNSRVLCPIQTCRGRAIFCSGSVNISCHCDSQPMVRGIAKSTVNISGLKPIAW